MFFTLCYTCGFLFLLGLFCQRIIISPSVHKRLEICSLLANDFTIKSARRVATFRAVNSSCGKEGGLIDANRDYDRTKSKLPSTKYATASYHRQLASAKICKVELIYLEKFVYGYRYLLQVTTILIA